MPDRTSTTPAGVPPGRAPAAIRLVPMRTEEFGPYLELLSVEYANDHVRDGQWTAAEAPRKAREQIDRILPRGLDSPDQYFRSIVADPTGKVVGRIWYAVRRDEGPPHLFIFDLLVFESERGHGYGEAALRALEPIARELGVGRIGLHVFGHNASAIRLYERIGYRATNLLMSKTV